MACKFRAQKIKIQKTEKRAHPELNQGPGDLQSPALTTELYTRRQKARNDAKQNWVAKLTKAQNAVYRDRTCDLEVNSLTL